MAVLILSGPPAAGKNTIAAAFARHLARCAVVDVDLVRWMVVQPHAVPWDGEEFEEIAPRDAMRPPRGSTAQATSASTEAACSGVVHSHRTPPHGGVY